MFQLETRNVETGVVYKSPLFNDFASARAEAQRVAKAGRRTVRVVQVPEAEHNDEHIMLVSAGIISCDVCSEKGW